MVRLKQSFSCSFAATSLLFNHRFGVVDVTGVIARVLLHDMDVFGIDLHADDRADLLRYGRLDHPVLVLIGNIDDHLVVNTLEGGGKDSAGEIALVLGNDDNVFGTDDNVDLLHGSKARVDTDHACAAEFNVAVGVHDAVDDVGFADEVGNETVGRLVVYVGRAADLLNDAVVHDDDNVRHRKSLLLVVSDVEEGDAETVLDSLELDLHFLAQLEVKCAERLVQKKNLRVVCKSSCDGNTLLLTARERVDTSLFKALESNKLEKLSDLCTDLGLRLFLYSHTESYIFINVEMGEECVTLENGVELSLVGRNVVDVLARKENIALVLFDEAADNPEGCCLAAARRTEQCDKGAVLDIKVEIVKNRFAVE